MTIVDGPPLTVLQRCSLLGYEHHVFISWPHQIEDRGAALVRALASDLEDRFRTYGGGSVFIDDRLKHGYRWDNALRTNLCRSAVLVSVIIPTFFDSAYCAIEWSIAETLQAARLANGQLASTVFIPIVLTGNMPLPNEVADLQLIPDFLPLLVHSRAVNKHPRWNQLVVALRDRVFEALQLVVHSEPDWPTQEALALAAGPKQFTWQPPRYAPGASKQKGRGFPGFVVEPRSK